MCVSPFCFQNYLLLIPHHYYTYYKQRYHYFLLDFCHLLTLAYLWLPAHVLGQALRGKLFLGCFSAANSQFLTTVLWLNAYVPHNKYELSKLYVHLAPSLVLSSIRW